MAIKDDELINESYKKSPRHFWVLLVLILFLFSGALFLQYALQHLAKEQQSKNPFTRVSNRDFSLFLWQFPEYMRFNAKTKTGYLTAFQYLQGVTVEPDLAEEWVAAPPELLRLYHIWNVHVGDVLFDRPIDPKEFTQFLETDPQWKPEYWKGKNAAEIPKEVKQAFVGWKNFFLEGAAINSYQPTEREREQLLLLYPQYGDAVWKKVLGENYLQSPFMRVTLYNFTNSRRGQ